MALQISCLDFKVKRNEPELVTPAKPTPHELKPLSNIDDQPSLCNQLLFVQFYGYQPSMEGKDSVDFIRKALAKTLVFYYPLAGRLREGLNAKLMVDCNEEGVLFIEADADVTIEQFGDNIVPPIPCFDELLYNVPGSDGIVGCPLLLIQITRLKCGGFIFAFRLSHTMSDASGIGQFLNALGEIARGAQNPSILPVWHREVLCARDPPRVTRTHQEYNQFPPDTSVTSKAIHRSFFFGPKEIASIRALLPYHLAAKSTTFEVLTAFVWRCKMASLKWQNPSQEIHFMCIVNARYGRCKLNPPLPEGFYGNGFVYPGVATTVENLLGRPLEYAVELVQKAKNEGTEEYVHSMIDLMSVEERGCYTRSGSSLVSDHTKAGFQDVDFGWGSPLYIGVPRADFAGMPGLFFINSHTNSKGDKGRLVVICMPEDAMLRFEKEFNNLHAAYSSF